MANMVTAFALGLAATLSPCFLPLYPGFLAYLTTQLGEDGVASWRQLFLGLIVLAGLMSSMLAVGAFITLIGVAAGRVLVFVTPIADLLVVFLGLLLLVKGNIFAGVARPDLPQRGSNLTQAFWYGLLYGPMLMPCAAPLFISVFTLSLTSLSLSGRLLYVLFFGLGLGTPLLLLSLLTQVRQRRLLASIRPYFPLIHRLAGLLLIAVGLADIVKQWPYIRLYLGIQGASPVPFLSSWFPYVHPQTNWSLHGRDRPQTRAF